MKGAWEEEPGLDLTQRREGAEPRGPDEGSQEGPGVGADCWGCSWWGGAAPWTEQGFCWKDLALNAERGKERQARGVGILSGGPQGATLGPLPRPPEPCHPGLLTKRMKAASARKSPFL